MSEPTEEGGDSPPDSPTAEEEQFQRDLQTAIQRSIEEAYGISNQPAASTSGLTTSSSQDEGEENDANDQPIRQEKPQNLKQEDDQEEEYFSGESDVEHDSLNGSSSEGESEENEVDDNKTVKSVGNQTDVQEESQPLLQEGDQEEESSSEDTDEDHNSAEEEETDNAPGSLTQEEIQFQKDLQIAIQRSLEENCGSRNRPAATTSEVNDSSSKDDSEENAADDNSVNAVGSQTDTEEESQPLSKENGREEEISSRDNGKEDDYQTASSFEEIKENNADEQPINQEKPQTVKHDDQEEEYSRHSDKKDNSLQESEENETDDKTVNPVASQADVEEESQPLIQEGHEEQESSSEDTDEQHDSPKEEGTDIAPRSLTPEEIQFRKDLQTAIQRSLEHAFGTSKPPGVTIIEINDSSPADDSEENETNDKTVNLVGTQADVEEESQPLKQEGDQEEEYISEDSDEEHVSPKESEVDSPPENLTREEIQFRKDLRAAIRMSLAETRRIRKQRAAAITEVKKSEYQLIPETGHSSKTLTGTFTEDKSEERKSDGNTVHASDNQPNVQEEAQAVGGENLQQYECASGDSGIKHDLDTGRKCRRNNSPTGDVTGDIEKITRFQVRCDGPREIDPDAPRCPVGEGALKKIFRQRAESAARKKMQSDAGATVTPTRGTWRRRTLSVWQYPDPKRSAYTDEFPTQQQIVTGETSSVSKNAAVSGTDTSDSMQGLMAQQQPASCNNFRKRWSQPHPICTNNFAYLQRQKTASDENEKDKPHTRDIFQEIRRWELREYMEANKRSRAFKIKVPAPTRDNNQLNVKNDNQQLLPPIKDGSEQCQLRYNVQRPVTNDSNTRLVLKVSQSAGQEKKTAINTEQPKKITGNEEGKKDVQDPQSSTRPVIVGAVLKKDEHAAPDNTKETSTVEEQNNTYTELLLRDIVRVYFEKKWPASVHLPGSSVQQKYEEPQIVKEKRPPFYKKVKNCSGSKVSNIPLKVTDTRIKCTGEQTVPEDEIKIREITRKLLEDLKEIDLNEIPKCNAQQGLEIKEIDLNETPKCVTQEVLGKTHQEKPDGRVIKHEEQQISGANTICDEQQQITPSVTDSADFNRKFLQIYVDEKEMSEKQTEAAGKFSSDRCKKIRYIRRRTKTMEKRNFTVVSTIYRTESDATANQENEVVVDEKQHYYTRTDIKNDIQSPQKAFSKEKHMEEMQASQYRYAHGKKLQQKPLQSATTEKEITGKKWKGKIFRKDVHSRQITGTVAENGHKSVSSQNMNITDCHNMKLGMKMNRNQPDFLRMVPNFYQNGCAEKEEGGSVITVPPSGTDVDDESYLEELTDSFDIVKQDISIIQEDIRRRAQRYGYMRGRRRRMASASRAKRARRSADDKKDSTQPKTGYLRRLPSISWKAPLQNNTLYDHIRKQWLSKLTDGTTSMDKSSSSELQKFTRSVSGRFVRWCSCSTNTNLCNDQHSPPPQAQGPPAQIQPGEVGKENQVSDKQLDVPVMNGIDNSEKSNNGPRKDNDVKDVTASQHNFEITQEQTNVIQAAIRNYLRTFGIPVHRVTSVSFVQDDSFEADRDSVKEEHILGEQLSSNDDSSKQSDNTSKDNNDDDEETQQDPGDDAN